MELNSKLIACNRKTKAFRANFEKLLAIAQCNHIKIMTACEFRVIDVLYGHTKPIFSIDVSQISKTVVSLSENLIIIHTLNKNPASLSDSTVNCGDFKWSENWRCEVKLPLININLSPLGDFLAISGKEVLSVWRRDNEIMQSFSNIVFYQKEEPKNVLAQVIKQVDLGNIIQQEITKDGRMIVFLEEDSKIIKILYQDKIVEQEPEKKEKAKEEKKEQNRYGPVRNQFMQLQQEKESDKLLLEDNPYANIVPISAEEQLLARLQDQKLKIVDFSCFEIKQHRNKISYFKLMVHDLFETQSKVLPNAELHFICTHIFRGYPQTPFFDVSFVEFPPVNPKAQFELQGHISKIFDSSNDHILKIKKDENKFGIYQNNYHETTIDWILILKDNQMEVYKIEGLRNFPCKNVSINIYNKVKMNCNPKDFQGASKIFSASCRDLNDVISIYCLNSKFQLLKFRKNFISQEMLTLALKDKSEESKNLMMQRIQTWKLDKLSIINQRNITDILVHPQLPFIAYIVSHEEIYFFIEEESQLNILKEADIKFAGAYSIHHSSHHHHENLKQSHFIKKAKWIKDLCQMMILYTDNAIGLLASHSLLKIMASYKHPDEYLKLWSEKRSLVGEKWDRLYEIDFQTENKAETLVDFEIISIKINNQDGSFAITIIVYTDNYSWYIYQLETSYLNGLKTMSKTNLLQSNQTEDTLLRILSTFNNFEDSNKVMLVVLTEVDSKKAPEIKQEIIEEQKSDFVQEEDSDDSDDGDIFAQFNKKPKKEVKKEIKVVVEAPKVIKDEVRLKLMSLEMSSNQKVQIKEDWKVELSLSYKNKAIMTRINKDLIGFMVQEESDKKEQILYIYEINSNRYLGLINLNQMLNINKENEQIDFFFASDKAKGSIIIYARNTLFLISQSAKEGISGKWSIISKINNITGLDMSQIENVKIEESYYKKLLLMINNKYIKIKNRFKKDPKATKKIPLATIFGRSQKSFALYDQKLLEQLYFKGYNKLVLKIIVKFMKAVFNATSVKTYKVSDFLDLDIEQLYKEIQQAIATLNEQSSAQTQVKKENAQSLFDDFYGGFDAQPNIMNNNKTEIAEVKQKEPSEDERNEQDFLEGFKKFVQLLKELGEELLPEYTQKEIQNLIIFINKFHNLFKKEFFAGPLADILLRQVFYETEEVKMEEDKAKERQIGEQVQAINILQIMSNLKQEATQSQGSVSLIQNWSSFKCTLALLPDTQDVIINEISNRFDLETNFTWEIMKKLCIPVWLKDISKLKVMTEKVAKGEYKVAGDEFGKTSRAEKTALWYLMLGKKQQLVNLYKIEPQYKKVYDLLINDFTLPKWKTTAEKNAMALMSKQNYYLAAAFFLLASNLKSALQVALSRLNDPILAVLICRVFEGDESESLQKIYQEHFIERGEKFGDPYLITLGRWHSKEYIKAVNSFKIESGGSSSIQNIMKPGVENFNIGLYPIIEEEIRMATSGGISNKVIIQLPLLSKYDFYVLDVIKAMKKLTQVKRELNKKWNEGPSSRFGGGGGGDLFDDFFADSSQSKKQKEEEEKKKKEQDQNKLQIDESKILQIVSYDASQSGIPLVSLILMSENVEFLDNVEASFKMRIGKIILGDLSSSFSQNIDFTEQVQQSNSGIRVLAENFQVDEDAAKDFVIKQCRQLGLIGLEVSFYLDMHIEDVAFKLEDYSVKLIEFVQSLNDFPFINYAKDKISLFENLTHILQSLEQIAECLLAFQYQQSITSNEIKKPEGSVNGGKGASKTNNQLKNALNGFNHQKTLQRFSIALNDPENDQLYTFSVDDQKTFNFKNQNIASQILGLKDIQINSDLDKALAKLNTKIRTLLIVYLTLIQICFISAQYQSIPSLLSQLRTLLNQQQNLSNQNFEANEQKFEKNLNIDYQLLKIKIQKLKYALQQNEIKIHSQNKQKEGDGYNIIESPVNMFEKKSPQKIEEEKKAEQQELKLNEFYHLWFKYIIAYNTSFVLKNCYSEGAIQNLINIRPSIINSRKIQEVIVSIMNQRLQSAEILKKFENMYRILENVTSYYFEHFLTMKERKVIVDSLLYSKDSEFKKISPQILNIFERQEKFEKFAKFMDLKSFISYMKDHELSLVYHTSKDVQNTYQIERTKDVFQSGIELFKLKHDPINCFAFDRCGRDIAVLGLQKLGIREIPLYKGFLCRNRQVNGLGVVDEELNNWNECLHRYDKYPLTNPTSDPIIAVVDQIYRQKTIHFIRVDKRKKGNTLVDREVSPPDFWSQIKSSEFSKSRSQQDITHEDNTEAIESHPYLPLYVTGNSKGLVCLWSFEQENDKSLDQWYTELDLKNATSHKHAIKKIQFSQYGDKLAVCNKEGSFSIYNFDTFESSKSLPIFQLKKSKEQKFNDFEYLNQDTVLAMSSLKPKKLWIFDTLIPQKNSVVMENQSGGNIVLPWQQKQQILTFNEKPGQMNIIDLRTNKLLHMAALSGEEITTTAINQAQDTIVVGFKDGVVKVINLDGKEFETRESYNMFPSSGGKKHAVQQVRIHPTSGALFACSQNGNFKLLRTKV